MFLSHCIPLLDRSGLNIQGAFNDSHSTPVEEVPEVQAITGCAGLRPHSMEAPLDRDTTQAPLMGGRPWAAS